MYGWSGIFPEVITGKFTRIIRGKISSISTYEEGIHPHPLHNL
jgi:hypothetical protein